MGTSWEAVAVGCKHNVIEFAAFLCNLGLKEDPARIESFYNGTVLNLVSR
jgi:hypothetical protein